MIGAVFEAKKEIRVKTILREALRGTALFRPTRDTYYWLFNREPLNMRRALRRFYSEFISPGDLVFDVGANVGQRSEVFLEIGAKVVAIEPNPACLAILRRQLRFRKLTIEEVAVGDTAGMATLHLSHSSGHSTLSSDWQKVSLERYGREWIRDISVPVVTLSSLVQKYGAPRFIKIDVEGFELQVLRTLPALPPFLSFEFFAEQLEVTTECLALKCFGPAVRYNVVLGECSEMHLSEWTDKPNLLRVLEEQRANGVSYGDIIVRN